MGLLVNLQQIMQKVISYLKQRPLWLVAALWLFFQLLWFAKFGLVFQLEAIKYLREAGYVLEHHQLSEFRYLFYLTTITIIAFSSLIGIGKYGALFIIMGINLWAYVYFFRALRRFFSSTLLAISVVFLLLSFWPFQSWSLFLFTECLFYSLVMVLLGHLLSFRSLSLRFLAICSIILFLLVISRPLGILFIPPVLLFVFFHLSKKQRLYFLAAGLGFLVLLNFVIQVVFTTTSDWNMTRALTEDSIICDIPRNDSSGSLDLSNHPNQFYQLLYYVTHNFSHFAGLALVRLKYFFGMVRDYYSFSHNALLVGYLILFYGSIIVRFRRIAGSLSRSILAFIFSSIAVFAATIALQCDDYHNRFFLTLTPMLALLTVVAWKPLIMRFSSFLKQRIN